MSEAAEKKQMPKKAAAKAPEKQPGIVVYIGPDIPGAKQYTTYNNGLSDVLKEKIIEHRVFESLVVPVEQLAKASVELAKEGSALNILYRKAGALRNK